MASRTQTPVKELVLIGFAGAIVALAALLSHVSTAHSADAQPPSLSTAGRGVAECEVVAEAFAARAAEMTADAKADALATSIEFPAQEARIVRLVNRRPLSSEPCLDELEVYGPDAPTNLALASSGAVASATIARTSSSVNSPAMPH